MEIFIDESGSFVNKGAQTNSWCVVAAFASIDKDKYKEKLAELKHRENVSQLSEIKLRHVSEDSYETFLIDLYQAGGVLNCIATDSGSNEDSFVKENLDNLAISIRDNIDKMKFETGKEGMKYLAKQIEGLSHQLYIQLFCQIYLMHSFINLAICYFVQRNPESLNKFLWRVDQKSPDIKTDFENAFEKICPAILQMFSLSEPGKLLTWCDYSHMKDYMYKAGDLPEYLVEKVPRLKDKPGLNIQKIIRDDIEFIDSISCEGVQIADLLASGLRKVLRQEFTNNERIANALGKLMIQQERNRHALNLITFGQETSTKDASFINIIKIMTNACRPMVAKN